MTAKVRILYRLKAQWAQQRVCRAVQQGKLINLKAQFVECANCTWERATMYDHRNYLKPLEVTPVCQWCNRKLGVAIETIRILTQQTQ